MQGLWLMVQGFKTSAIVLAWCEGFGRLLPMMRVWDLSAGERDKGLSSGFRVQCSVFRVQGSGIRVQGSMFRVQGSGIRVQGSGFRFENLAYISYDSEVQGLELQVYTLRSRV